jgi:hypothetical protein
MTKRVSHRSINFGGRGDGLKVDLSVKLTFTPCCTSCSSLFGQLFDG